MTSELILCPDCPRSFTSRDAFVAHREQQHPPTQPIRLEPAGIPTGERHGYQPPDPKEN